MARPGRQAQTATGHACHALGYAYAVCRYTLYTAAESNYSAHMQHRASQAYVALSAHQGGAILDNTPKTAMAVEPTAQQTELQPFPAHALGEQAREAGVREYPQRPSPSRAPVMAEGKRLATAEAQEAVRARRLAVRRLSARRLATRNDAS